MSEGKHTPIPWIFKKVKTSNGYCYKIGSPDMVAGSYGAICAYDDATTLNPHAEGVQQANAEFIVKVCNSYERDQETIKVSLEACEAIVAAADNGNYQHALHKAEAALAPAKKKH